MKKENKALLKKYIICFCVASVLSFIVIWIKGFFTDSIAVNIQILSDAFFVSGILLTMFAIMLYISGEGALLGIGFVLRNVVLTFIPMGRAKQELYSEYRERKLKKAKKEKDNCILVVGLLFLFIGIIFTVIWYVNFYNI
ncbi:MAG: DUF3899 domain-containing protein [Clostridia bacterium]|nr:DUF3899 domain-containing protein [Clostridia bacterium]